MGHYWRPLPVGIGEAAFVMRLQAATDEMSCVFGFDFATEPSITKANDLHSRWATRVMPLVTTGLDFVRVEILYQSDSTHQTRVDSTNAVVAGGVAGSLASMMAVNTAFLVRKKTGYAGRRMRGRAYIPGVPEAHSDGAGLIPSANFTPAAAAITALGAELVAEGACLIHSVLCTNPDDHHEGPHAGVPLPATPITALELDDHVATQRRRLRR